LLTFVCIIYNIIMKLFFGDSFIGIFKLLKDKDMIVYKYKGASLKGLIKKDNTNRKDIINIVNTNNIDCCIFSFGQVDLHFSYYYKKFVKKEKFMMKNMIYNYIKFIHELPNCKNKIVIGIYPSAVNDNDVYDQLLHYGIITNDIYIDNKHTTSNIRHNLYTKFNKYLEDACKIYNIEYIDIGNIVLNKKNNVKQVFIDPINKYNIHLLWEPLLPIIIKKINTCYIKNNYTHNLKNSLNKYVVNKKTRKRK
jgi:hypothetical protein